eukprot:Protomagalhaensia_sp_Gyna_25__3954@NODE_3561_length_534_cov_533_206061_g3006_i0_p1_GENE_NODE_3561_length_534_cov_533_206061_g3006_i0NODE_3561_length_534_cov_533_206061_g3006_i0_p1_ORF_typecomplete_len108_score3_99Mito_morph_reg/PF14972_6/0_17_NODE_3561_length_534_cov_533_206061_g3006_i0100423
MAYVRPNRWMDSAVMALFLMVLSATTLHIFGHFWAVAQTPKFAQYKVGEALKTLFKFSTKFDFNLTHILLMSIIICLLSLRPDHEGAPSKPAEKKDRSKKPEVPLRD